MRFETSHAEAILALYRRSVTDRFPAFEYPEALSHPERFPWFRQDGTVVATDETGHIAGFALGKIDPKSSDAFLMGLFVDPGHRNTGIGGRLLGEIEQWARANGSASLKIRPSGEGYFSLGMADDSPFLTFFTRRGFSDAKFIETG